MTQTNLILPFYTLEEVARIIRKSPRTIFRMLNDGRLTARKDESGKYIFDKATIETYLAAQDGNAQAKAKQTLLAIKTECETYKGNGCEGCAYRSAQGCAIGSTPDKWTV